ncbi:MAG: bifunctional riboflavin kinase/FAD synthetase [Chloroflexi bacterium]|nr:bifunctional riboflavin kinase/FAD synthetase [Chloroflexota bacterium]
MRVLHGFDAWPAGPLHLAIGVFDGVHRGHQQLIVVLRTAAERDGALPIAATFDPLPIQVLAPGAPPSALTDAAERAELLARAGAEAVVLFPSSASFLGIPAREFVSRLAAAGDVRRIVVGPDFHFGHQREGDVALLRHLGGERGWTVEVIAPVMADGTVISSTRIRNLLVAGDVKGAAELLGRPYAVRGRIAHGDKRGRALGYPTINVATPPERLLPRDGIYATWVVVGSERRRAATSLGVRPTFGAGERVLESFILDLSADLYGEDVEMTFVERLRDELRFETPEALVEQIARDVEATRQALAPAARGGA